MRKDHQVTLVIREAAVCGSKRICGAKFPRAYAGTCAPVMLVLSHTIAGHDVPSTALAQDRVDDLADRLGTDLLAAVWATEFSIFLRHRERADWDWFVAGKSADLFLGRVRATLFSDVVRN
jgi:hypothetical protein